MLLDGAIAPTLWLGYKNEQAHFCNTRLLSSLRRFAPQDDWLRMTSFSFLPSTVYFLLVNHHKAGGFAFIPDAETVNTRSHHRFDLVFLHAE